MTKNPVEIDQRQTTAHTNENNKEFRKTLVALKRAEEAEIRNQTWKANQERSDSYAAPKILKLKESANRLKESGVQSYMDWIAGANDIVLAMITLNKAITAKFEYYHPAERGLTILGFALAHLVLDGLEWMGIYHSEPKQNVSFTMQVSKEGKLEASYTVDGKNMLDIPQVGQTLRDIIDHGLNRWLDQQNCVRDAQGKLLNKQTGQPLQTAEIENFIHNKQNVQSLQSFLSHYLEMNINEIKPTIMSTHDTLNQLLDQENQNCPRP